MSSNQESRENDKFILCFSYGVLVVAYDKHRKVFFVTDKKWSQTTTKHINKFVNPALARDGGKVVKCPQSDLEKLHKEVLSELYTNQL